MGHYVGPEARSKPQSIRPLIGHGRRDFLAFAPRGVYKLMSHGPIPCRAARGERGAFPALEDMPWFPAGSGKFKADLSHNPHGDGLAIAR